jgi:Carboxypeptidase regulatory-like domain/TonB dependent receptor/TonB-dependent Receptor Plug Domain
MTRIDLPPIDNLIEETGRAALMRYCSSLLILFLTVFLLSSVAPAQSTTSTIQGTVKDPNGAAIAGAAVKVSESTRASERSTTTDAEGFYRITALPAGTYTLTVSGTGFATNTSNIELTLNRVVTFDVGLEVGGVGAVVTVQADSLPLLERNASASGATITPRQISELPVNGRDYLSLLQLVPGVAINRQANPGSDNTNPVLGERSGNNNFLIDGQPNKDTVNGGPAAQFNQETIAEFQVLTAGYKAEFGQASGAIVNVITMSGGNAFHGAGSLFVRNNGFDGNNSLDKTKTPNAPFLHVYDYSLALGGPVIKDKVFFFGSSERITENRVIDFKFPNTGTTPGGLLVQQLLRNQELPFDTPSQSFETRNFLKFNEQLGRHQLTEEMNYTNRVVRNFLPLALSQSLPSARNDSGARHLLLALGDTMLLGEQSNPWVVTLRGAYRGEPADTRPAHPEAGGGTLFVPFTTNTCCVLVPGDLPTTNFGNPNTATNLDQKYTSFGASTAKAFGQHDFKFGWNFLRTKVDGVESQTLQSQLFTTVDDFVNFGPINGGITLLLGVGAPTAAGNEIHLRNNYNGLFVQDDWKLRHNLTLNLGVRWDYDSEFKSKTDFSPRVGVAWAVTPKTLVRGNFGVFYDQFRLGLVRDVPAFGGADQRLSQLLLFPRGFYGSPSFVSSIAFLSGLPGGCFSNRFTDAQITAGGLKCGFPGLGSLPMIGVDRLNRVVANGHAPVPANAVINVNNVQSLTGLTPDQYAAQASAAIGQPAGYFVFGPFGVLNNAVLPPRLDPTTVDGSFKVPHTLGYSVGVQREIGRDMVIEADYYHRDIRDLLGVRKSNLAFQSRVSGRTFLPPFTQGEIETFGPFYEGTYDALILNLSKRFSRRFLLGANYTFSNATDNSLGINTNPSDNFIGTVPIVSSTEAGVLKTNANGPYTRANGTFVAQAGTFLNGPNLDKGPSSLAVDHIFQVNGLMEFPWQIQVSGIFRVQSGFHFSRNSLAGVINDPDGDGNTNGIDHGPGAGRNAFTSPPYVNLDMRLAKRFSLGERVKAQFMFAFFNLFNRQNPAAVSARTDVVLEPFGKSLQVLPGREGQIGFRIEF